MLGLFGQSLFYSIIAIGLLLGIWILLSNTKSKVNWFFFGITVTILLWNVFAFQGYRGISENLSTFFFRLNYGSVALYFLAFYYFALYFPKASPRRHRWLDWVVNIIFSLLAIASVFTNLVINSVSIPTGGKLIMRTGSLGNLFYLLTFGLTIYIVISLFQKYKTLIEEEKSKTKFFLVGTVLYAGFNIIFNIVLSVAFPENYRLTQLGDLSAILFLGFVGYAVMKHQLFNIKLIATESVVIILSLILFIQIFISNNFNEGSINAIIWVLATYGGYRLVKSVRVEIQQREQLAQLAQQLEKANDHLKEVDKLKDDFLSMASHELNTPIAAIQGYLSMILVEKMAGVIPPKAKKYLDSVFTSSQRLAHMVKDLLNVSRIESNRIHLIYEEKQIEDVIEQAVTEVMSKAREAKHALTFEKPKTKIPKTWFDVTRITEIIINILGNAIKYTDPGGKITARVMHDEDKIVVSVEDNGRGIPKDKQNTVFEKFSQVDVLKDQVKGTGLGMYISKKFIELHNGKIWFHSEGEGKGTTFFFSLPILTKKPYDAHAGEDSVLH